MTSLSTIEPLLSIVNIWHLVVPREHAGLDESGVTALCLSSNNNIIQSWNAYKIASEPLLARLKLVDAPYKRMAPEKE